jgi:hypothetical protein
MDGKDYYDIDETDADDDRDEPAEEVTCSGCGRDHIPDEGDPTQADTCYECQNRLSPGYQD